jgi:hypothetical protein
MALAGRSVDSALVQVRATGRGNRSLPTSVHEEKGLGLCIPFQALLGAQTEVSRKYLNLNEQVKNKGNFRWDKREI